MKIDCVLGDETMQFEMLANLEHQKKQFSAEQFRGQVRKIVDQFFSFTGVFSKKVVLISTDSYMSCSKQLIDRFKENGPYR